MNAQQRGPFEKKAKEHKLGPHKEPVKYTSQGIPLSIIDRQKDQLEVAQKTMTRTIKEVVNNAITDNSKVDVTDWVRIKICKETFFFGHLQL